ncbi:MAG: hypothetical protein HYT09_00160 [Candidatus Levybacteria bacterium]|nr:hypothetical protein [Candidatus Levybacteria bacterium]
MNKIKRALSSFVLFYLRFFAKAQLKKIRPIIIGVAGSSGKSSTTSLSAQILSSKFKVKYSAGKNSESGIPLDILGIEMKNYGYLDWFRVILLAPFKLLTNWQKYQIYIAEMGIDSPFPPKNMTYLLKIVRPKIGILTNISIEHSQYFDPLVNEPNEEKRKEKILDLIGNEELNLIRAIPKDGFSILNIDDTRIREIHRNILSTPITISGTDPTADYFIENEESDISKFEIKFTHKNNAYNLKIKRPLPTFFSYSFLFPIALSHALGVPIEEGIKVLEENFYLPPGRMSIFEGINDSLIIDSSYNNATIEPISGILDFMAKIGKKRRKVAVIGDMREQGSLSKIQHELLAEKISQTVNLAILIGPMLQNFSVPILEEADFPHFSFLTFSDAEKRIKSTVKKGDIVLVKGSQNTLFLERAVEILLKDKDNIKSLPRRGPFWDRRRAKTP